MVYSWGDERVDTLQLFSRCLLGHYQSSVPLPELPMSKVCMLSLYCHFCCCCCCWCCYCRRRRRRRRRRRYCYCFLSTKIILYSFYYDLTFVLPPVSFIQQQHRWILVFINAQIRGEISKTLTAAALKKLRDDRTEPIVCTYMHTNVSNVWGLFHRRATTTSMTTAIRRSTLFTWVTAINNSYS